MTEDRGVEVQWRELSPSKYKQLILEPEERIINVEYVESGTKYDPLFRVCG